MFKRLFTSFLILWALLTLAAPAFASSDNYISSRAYFEDTSNSLTFSQVKDQIFKSFGSIFAKGYSNSTFWIKARVEAAPELARQKKDLILRIEPGYLDEIELFDPLEPARTNRFAGDRHPWQQYEYKSLVFNFVIPAASQPRDIWLKLKTHSTNMMYVRAFDAEGLQKVDQQFQMLVELAALASLVFVLWGVLIYTLTKDFLIGVFTIKQVVGFFFVASYIGFFRLFLSDYFSAHTLDFISNVLIFTATLSTIIFHYVFFIDYKPKPWWRITLASMGGASLLELILVLLGHQTLALQINMSVITFIGPFMFLMVIFGIDWPLLTKSPTVLPKRVLIIFHSLYLSLVVTMALPSLGFKALTNAAPHMSLIYWFLTGVLTILMLQYRNKRVLEEQALLVGLAKQEAELEKQQREQERHFLQMLTHEIKTPLSVIKMASTSDAGVHNFKEHLVSAVQDINELIERCIVTDKFESKQFSLQVEQVNFSELTEKVISNFRAKASFKSSIAASVTVHSDRQLLEIIITNLIENAVKYGAKKQPIEISLSEDSKGMASFKVSNLISHQGPLDTKKIFNKYYRGEFAYEKNGSGLGLYLVKNFLQMLGGNVSCKSTEDVVTFVIKLPKQHVK